MVVLVVVVVRRQQQPVLLLLRLFVLLLLLLWCRGTRLLELRRRQDAGRVLVKGLRVSVKGVRGRLVVCGVVATRCHWNGASVVVAVVVCVPRHCHFVHTVVQIKNHLGLALQLLHDVAFKRCQCFQVIVRKNKKTVRGRSSSSAPPLLTKGLGFHWQLLPSSQRLVSWNPQPPPPPPLEQYPY